MHSPLLYYLITINAASFGFMLIDKHRAKKGYWRIPERTLLALALAGGSLGALAGMYLVRHKTRKNRFTKTVPLMLLAHLCIGFYLYRFGLL